MGTHPIFESDFDCLTDMKPILCCLLGFLSVLAEENKSILELIYRLDYRADLSANKLNFPDSAKVKRKNREWMEKVEKNEKMKNFILDMASINGTITMTPVAGLDMDAT